MNDAKVRKRYMENHHLKPSGCSGNGKSVGDDEGSRLSFN